MSEEEKNNLFKSGSYPADSLYGVGDEVHLRDYLKVLVKHRWMVLAAFVVIVTTVAIGSFAMTPVYEASTTIQIEKEAANVLKFEDILPVDTSGGDYYKTQEIIIQSRVIARSVIEELSLWNHAQFQDKGLVRNAQAAIAPVDAVVMDELIDDFLELLNVNLVRKSRLALINFKSNDPELSANVANQVARAYIDFNLEYKFKATETARDWLSGQLSDFQAKVERSEEDLNEFARRNGIFSLEKDENLVIKRLENLNEALATAEADRIKKESFFREVSNNSPLNIPAVVSDDLELINGLKKELSSLEAEYSKFSKLLYKKDYPKMVRLKAEMDALDSRINREARGLVDRSEVAYKISLAREKLLRSSFDKQKKLALQIKEKSIQYNILKREVDTNKELYSGLLQRLKETGVAAGLETSNIQIVDKAVSPLRPSSPKKKINILISMFAGLFVGVGLAFSIEYFDNTVKDPDEISRVFGLTTLGLIPSLQSTLGKKGRRDKKGETMPGAEDLGIVTHSFPRSSMSESFHTFRTSLLFSTPGKPPQTILITSSSPSEGKTTVSCNLGILLAQSGSKVLIIDADLRRPACHKAFKISSTPGITDYLTGHMELRDVIKPTLVDGLSVMPSGPISPNPPELLDSEQFAQAIEELRGLYDFII
ncbi:MAG: polysaccharide biosynthesis tyrosine autokinase, partial [Proteobacteria bacterium]|nr:polysaccharide biosynthesis tyrosine autokinase [Pseudomonadota bacterium]